MNYQTLLITIEDGIAIITINRPDKLNALNDTVIKELGIAVNKINTDDQVFAAIITGSGQKAFVAGADISGFPALSKEEGVQLSKKGQDVFQSIESSEKPIIAAINGFALGGGCELAMACHFRIASDNAKFGQPEVNLGLLPGYGGTQRLVQLIGKGRALELLLTGNMIDAVTAFNYGLVNHVVAIDDLLTKAKSILSMIATKAPKAITACIKAANQAYDDDGVGYQTEADFFGQLLETSDAKEGIAAFLEKRKAVFTGK